MAHENSLLERHGFDKHIWVLVDFSNWVSITNLIFSSGAEVTEVFDVEETVQLQFSKRFTLPTYVDGPIPQAKTCDLSEPLQFQKQLILLDAELNKTKSLLNGT